MDKFDSFLSSKVSPELSERIKAAAQKEFELNSKRERRKKFMLYFLPALTTVAASFFIFQLNLRTNFLNPASPEADEISLMAAVEQPEAIEEIAIGEDSVEMLDDLGFLEEMDDIVLIAEEDWEG